MRCLICDVEMRITEREGVEIDYCPRCRGVWLDRGELEKIMALAESLDSRDRHDRDDDHHEDAKRRREEPRHNDKYRRDDKYRDESDGRYRERRKEGFFGNLFDIFGD